MSNIKKNIFNKKMNRYIFNPQSKRFVGEHKGVHLKLLKEGIVTKRAPVYAYKPYVKWVKPVNRKKMRKECGGRCFLKPKEEKYPICSGGNNCKISCKGLFSAMRIARIQKDEKVLNKAIKVFKQNCKV